MFDLQELNYILAAIQTMPINSTNDGRNKAAMTSKVCDLMDELAAPPKEPAGKPKKAQNKDA